MGIVIYVSNTSGNKEIKKKQDHIRHILDCKKIDYDEVDISDAANEEKKLFMRSSAKAKEGANVPMPPQVFSDQTYLGDYDAFLEANECDTLPEFLNLAAAKETSEATVTLAEKSVETPEISPYIVDPNLPIVQNKITIRLASTEQSTENGTE